MLSLASAEPVHHFRRMAGPVDDKLEAKLLGRALAVLRERAGYSQEAAGERFGISGQGWSKYETGRASSIFQPSTQQRLAEAVDATVDDLARERARLTEGRSLGQVVVDLHTERPRASTSVAPRYPESTLLPVRDRAQAGAWLLADDYVQEEPRRYPAVRDPRFPTADQWLTEVAGDSVNKLHIYGGDLVHCVDAVAIGYFPRTDDVVEVERLRFEGSERELTIKQVEVTEGGVLLWPRSTNPRWQQPLELRSGVAEHEDLEVRIRGLVLASIRRF